MPLWAGARAVERYLYLADPRLHAFNESSLLTIGSTSTTEGFTPLVDLLEWEYWDGERWRELADAPIETAANEVALIGPVQMIGTTVQEKPGFYVRGRLAEVRAAGPRPAERLVAGTSAPRTRTRLIAWGGLVRDYTIAAEGDLEKDTLGRRWWW